MKKRKDVVHDPIIIDRVRELRRAGYIYRRISDLVGISESAVARICTYMTDVPNVTAKNFTVINPSNTVVKVVKDHIRKVANIMVSKDMTDREFWTYVRELSELYQCIKGGEQQ